MDTLEAVESLPSMQRLVFEHLVTINSPLDFVFRLARIRRAIEAGVAQQL